MKQISTVTQMISGVDNVNLLSCTTYKHCAIYCGLKPWCIWLGFWLWFLPSKIKSSTKVFKSHMCFYPKSVFTAVQIKSTSPLCFHWLLGQKNYPPIIGYEHTITLDFRKKPDASHMCARIKFTHI